MDRVRRDNTKRRKRNMVDSVAGSVDSVGSAISKNLPLARNVGVDDGSYMAGDRWSSIYRYGIGRSGVGADRMGVQPGYRRSFWPGRCHGHLVSGALSGLWYRAVRFDVGTVDCISRVAVPVVVSEKDKGSDHTVYPLPGSRDVDSDGSGMDRRVRRRTGRGRYLRGSFTIEAALLVPLILGILYLLLQTVVSLHNTVSGEARRYQEQYEIEAQESWRFVQIAGAILEEWEEWKS